MNGVVYAGFGSHCDLGPWQGWVFGVSTAGEVKARWVVRRRRLNGAGIWQSGSGTDIGRIRDAAVRAPATPGRPTTPTPGHTPPASLGESVVRLAVQADGSLKAVDFFAPFDASELDARDADFASGGVTGAQRPVLRHAELPPSRGRGRQGRLRVPAQPRRTRRLQAGLGRGGQGRAADRPLRRRVVAAGCLARRRRLGLHPDARRYGGGRGFLRVYQYGVSGTGAPTLSLQATSSDSFGFSSGAPVITSNGTTPGSALVWIEWTSGGTGTGAQLRAYDPVPVEGKPVLRWSAPIGTSSKFAMPGVGAGRLYVGTRDGKVLAFGSPITAPLTGPTTNFPTTTIGSSSEKTLTLTATTSLTVTKLTSDSPQFIAGTPSLTLPAALSAGQTIQVPITFTPAQTGLIGGALDGRNEPGAGLVRAVRDGAGGHGAARHQPAHHLLRWRRPSAVTSTGAATFSNVGSAPLTINAVKLPAAPFGASGLPAVGSKIAPGESVTVNVTFNPTAEGIVQR